MKSNLRILSVTIALFSIYPMFAQDEIPEEEILQPIKATSNGNEEPKVIRNEIVEWEKVMVKEAENEPEVCVPEEEPEERLFVNVEQVAEFPGGNGAMMQWIADQIRYPEKSKKEGISGRVIVKIVIEKDGTVTNAQVVKGVNPELDKEAIRVIESMPKWTPGRMNGEIVRSYYYLPVTFRLPEE